MRVPVLAACALLVAAASVATEPEGAARESDSLRPRGGSGSSDAFPARLSLALRVAGSARQLVDLAEHTRAVSPGFEVYEVDGDGVMRIADSRSQPQRCRFYSGRLRGDADSLVAAALCGARVVGVVQRGGDVAQIDEPLQPALQAALKRDAAAAAERGEGGDASATSSGIATRKALPALQVTANAVEYMLVAESVVWQRWVAHPSGLSLAEYAGVLAVLSDSLFLRANLDIGLSLRSLVVWTSNPIDTVGSASEVLLAFRGWGRNNTLPARDAAGLLLGGSLGGVIGLAYTPGNICEGAGSSSMYSINREWVQFDATTAFASNLAITATILTHEVGHNLGVTLHALEAGCNGSFIMNAGASLSNFNWDTCSTAAIAAKLPAASCLRAIANPNVAACRSGEFRTQQGACAACSRNCAECARSAVECTKCSENAVLQGGVCLPACLSGTFATTNDSVPAPLSRFGRFCAQCPPVLACGAGAYLECNTANGGPPRRCVNGSQPLPSREGLDGDPSASEGEGGLTGWAIAVIVIVLLLVLAAAAVVAFAVYRRRQHAGQEQLRTPPPKHHQPHAPAEAALPSHSHTHGHGHGHGHDQRAAPPPVPPRRGLEPRLHLEHTSSSTDVEMH